MLFMKQLSFRLKPGQYLKEEIVKVAKENHVKAGVVLCAVGSLKRLVLRLAGATVDGEQIMDRQDSFEIVSMTGTVSENGCHLHLSASDQEGYLYGGHLKDGCEIDTTVELVIGIFDDVVFDRVMDEETGFKELVIREI